MISRNDPCYCGSGKKWKKCHFPNLPKNSRRDHYLKTYQILLKNEAEIEGIKASCKLAASILKKTCEMAKAGVTTNELNDFAVSLHKKANAKPAPLGYGDPPFPKAICTSLNDVICHGIPDDRPLQDGDAVNIDVTCILNGYYGDCSKMVLIGDVSDEKKLVTDVSYECLMESIKVVKPGAYLYEIGDKISDIAEEKDCSVVEMFVGHGVGVDFHEAPQVPHHRNRLKIPLEEGMTFTIEPMINAGSRKGYIDETDGWTARTIDGMASAQWEHTLLVTKTGVEILTLS